MTTPSRAILASARAALTRIWLGVFAALTRFANKGFAYLRTANKVAAKVFSYLRRTRLRYWLAGGLTLALWVGYGAAGSPSAPEATVRLVRHVSVVYKDRPVVRTSFVDRLVYKTTKPDTVWKTLPGEVDTLVRNFCSPDTTAASERLLLLSGRVESRRLTLYGFTNHGVAYHATWPVAPTYQFVADQDSVVLQAARLQFHLPSLVSHGAAFGLGALTVLVIRAVVH